LTMDLECVRQDLQETMHQERYSPQLLVDQDTLV